MRPGLEFSLANRLRRIVTLVAVLVLTILLVFYFEREGNEAYSGLVRFAVPLYSLVLALMVLASAHQGSGSERYSILIFSGALLFMFSDLLIALGAFSNALAFDSVHDIRNHYGHLHFSSIFDYPGHGVLPLAGRLNQLYYAMLDYKGHQFNTPNDYFTHLLEENGMPNILGDFIEETIKVGGASVHLRVLRTNEDAPTAVFIPGTSYVCHVLC